MGQMRLRHSTVPTTHSEARAWTALKLQVTPVELGRSGDRDWIPETLLCMAAAPRVLDQFLHLLGRCGTLQVDGETDAVKGGAGAVHAELVRDIKAAANLNLALFDGNIVKMREPRNLGEQSKGGADEEKRQGSRAQVGAAALLGFVAFETKATRPAFQGERLPGYSPLPES